MRGWEISMRRYLYVVIWVLLAGSNVAFAAPLNLTLDQVTDISALNFGGVGGLTYDPILGQLWISDAAGDGSSPTPGNTNKVALIDPLSGGVVTDFDASAGNVFRGPDGIALEPATGHLFLFSAFLDITAGVTTAAGVTVRTLTIPASSKYAGAAFNPLGQLWVAERPNLTTAKDNLFQLDPLTGTATSTDQGCVV